MRRRFHQDKHHTRIAVANELNYCGVSHPQGCSLYSLRGGATVLIDCGNQGDLAGDVKKAVQEYAVDHLVKHNPKTNRKLWIENGKGGSQSVGPFKICMGVIVHHPDDEADKEPPRHHFIRKPSHLTTQSSVKT